MPLHACQTHRVVLVRPHACQLPVRRQAEARDTAPPVIPGLRHQRLLFSRDARRCSAEDSKDSPQALSGLVRTAFWRCRSGGLHHDIVAPARGVLSHGQAATDLSECRTVRTVYADSLTVALSAGKAYRRAEQAP